MHNVQNDDGKAITRRAAMYVRMSTDHQKYSTENQADTIREYAAKHHIEIVETYADAGKSPFDGGYVFLRHHPHGHC